MEGNAVTTIADTACKRRYLLVTSKCILVGTKKKCYMSNSKAIESVFEYKCVFLANWNALQKSVISHQYTYVLKSILVDLHLGIHNNKGTKRPTMEAKIG